MPKPTHLPQHSASKIFFMLKYFIFRCFIFAFQWAQVSNNSSLRSNYKRHSSGLEEIKRNLLMQYISCGKYLLNESWILSCPPCSQGKLLSELCFEFCFLVVGLLYLCIISWWDPNWRRKWTPRRVVVSKSLIAFALIGEEKSVFQVFQL